MELLFIQSSISHIVVKDIMLDPYDDIVELFARAD